MVPFKEFISPTPWNDMVVQRALAEVDTGVLATAFVGLAADAQAVFTRNMSRRAAALVAGQAAAARNVPPSRIEAARDLLAQVLRRHADAAQGEQPPDPGEALPAVAVDSPEAIVATFSALAAYVTRHGVLPLEKLESSITHPLLRMGIELLVDGTDPLLVRSILEKYQETYLQQARAALSMIVDGVDALAERNLPPLVEMKLRAWTARDWPRG